MASYETVSAAGSSGWLALRAGQGFEITSPSWSGVTATLQIRFTPSGVSHAALDADGNAISATANYYGVADCDCELQITTSGTADITLRRGK